MLIFVTLISIYLMKSLVFLRNFSFEYFTSLYFNSFSSSSLLTFQQSFSSAKSSFFSHSLSASLIIYCTRTKHGICNSFQDRTYHHHPPQFGLYDCNCSHFKTSKRFLPQVSSFQQLQNLINLMSYNLSQSSKLNYDQQLRVIDDQISKERAYRKELLELQKTLPVTSNMFFNNDRDNNSSVKKNKGYNNQNSNSYQEGVQPFVNNQPVAQNNIPYQPIQAFQQPVEQMQTQQVYQQIQQIQETPQIQQIQQVPQQYQQVQQIPQVQIQQQIPQVNQVQQINHLQPPVQNQISYQQMPIQNGQQHQEPPIQHQISYQQMPIQNGLQHQDQYNFNGHQNQEQITYQQIPQQNIQQNQQYNIHTNAIRSPSPPQTFSTFQTIHSPRKQFIQEQPQIQQNHQVSPISYQQQQIQIPQIQQNLPAPPIAYQQSLPTPPPVHYNQPQQIIPIQTIQTNKTPKKYDYPDSLIANEPDPITKHYLNPFQEHVPLKFPEQVGLTKLTFQDLTTMNPLKKDDRQKDVIQFELCLKDILKYECEIENLKIKLAQQQDFSIYHLYQQFSQGSNNVGLNHFLQVLNIDYDIQAEQIDVVKLFFRYKMGHKGNDNQITKDQFINMFSPVVEQKQLGQGNQTKPYEKQDTYFFIQRLIKLLLNCEVAIDAHKYKINRAEDKKHLIEYGLTLIADKSQQLTNDTVKNYFQELGIYLDDIQAKIFINRFKNGNYASQFDFIRHFDRVTNEIPPDQMINKPLA